MPHNVPVMCGLIALGTGDPSPGRAAGPGDAGRGGRRGVVKGGLGGWVGGEAPEGMAWPGVA